jgi:hypothetical protein
MGSSRFENGIARNLLLLAPLVKQIREDRFSDPSDPCFIFFALIDARCRDAYTA